MSQKDLGWGKKVKLAETMHNEKEDMDPSRMFLKGP